MKLNNSEVIFFCNNKNSEKLEFKKSQYWIEYYPDLIFCFSSIDMENEALLDARVTAKPDGTLNVKMARREDAGMYKVRASNSEGKTNLKFKLDVQYAPT